MNAETSQKAFYTLEEACEELKRWGSIEYTPATLINNALQTMFAVNAMHPLLSLNLTNPRGAYVAGDLSLTPREIKGLWGFDTAPTPAGDDLYCFLRTLRDEGLINRKVKNCSLTVNSVLCLGQSEHGLGPPVRYNAQHLNTQSVSL